ncbi:MAG: LysM peptidoglycan-binding domain-containing protein [Phaeodactylibacter sp.]|uniref:glucosaminidase domain-containing protein n=1 Tax=Phaeodactylibacter sp. TaxID=1940289 RepID=UPI0032F03F81
MNRSSFFILFSLSLAFCLQAQGNTHQEYLERFKEMAILEMERTGIPASIKLAQGLLESGAGTSDLARRANNHFGIKCGSGWDGRTYYKKDDDVNDRGELIESCFRSYKNPDASYRAHSEFLRDPNKQYRYGFLFRLDPTDYKAWARGLRQAGYATSATYASKLIDIIDRYELHRYDRMTSTGIIAGGEENVPQLGGDGTDAPNVVVAGQVFLNNDVQYVLTQSGETLQEVALRTNADLTDLVRFNDNQYSRNRQLEQGTVVYVQSKRNSFRGKRQWHYVKNGETMFSISQIYGIDLGRLYRRNQLETGQMAAVGERLKIRGWNISDPPKLSRGASETTTAPDRPDVIDFPEPEPPSIDEGPIDPIVIEDEVFEPDNDFDFDEDFLEPITPPPGNRPDPRPDNRPTWNDRPANTGTDNGFDDDRFNTDTNTTPVTQPDPPAPQPSSSLHTVVKGDTLFNISRRYNLTVDRLKALNGLTSNTIFIGQQLRVR